MTDHIWSVEEIIGLLETRENTAAAKFKLNQYQIVGSSSPCEAYLLRNLRNDEMKQLYGVAGGSFDGGGFGGCEIDA